MAISSFDQGTLGYMKDKIADELARSDLTDQIADKIGEAIAFYQNDRFVFNESRDITFSTVADQAEYGAAANAAIPSLLAFDYLILYLGSIPWPLKRTSPQDVEILQQNGLVRGQPYRYCYYNKKIRMGPVPDNVYSMRIAGQITYAAPASNTETANPWMVDAERLIRTRAKGELALHVMRDKELATEMLAQAQEAYDNLKGLTNRIVGSATVRPMTF